VSLTYIIDTIEPKWEIEGMGEKYRPEIYTVAEIKALLKTFSKRYPTPTRNAAMIAVAYSGGLRCAEVLALRMRDIRADGECFIENGKGGKSRTVYLNDSAMAYVERWKDKRRELGIKRGPMFCTSTAGAVLPSYVRAMMTRAGKKAQLTKRCHFHGLRHSFAMETVRGKTPLNVVRKALGHSSLAVTTAYLDHINGDDLREASNAVPEF
jgi:site-specific recombinase XerD